MAGVVLGALIALIALGSALAVLVGSSRWRAKTDVLYAAMVGARTPHPVATYDPRELEGLPPPVQRYFRAVLTAGQPVVASVFIEHTGTFNTSESAQRWVPFTSAQRVVTRRPGFVWDARVRMAPGMRAHVHDAYVAGRGVLTAKLFGLLTVMREPDTPELAHGELMRFLGEAAWYPTALLHSQGITWFAVDGSRARATITDGTTTLQLVFHFDADGLISSVYSDGRHRNANGERALMPWQGRFWNYRTQYGMRVPTEGEVAWLYPTGELPYWRGRTVRLEYEFAQ